MLVSALEACHLILNTFCAEPHQVATDEDIRHQVDSGIKAFDLVDHDLLPEASHFRLRKHTRFTEVKLKVTCNIVVC